MDAGRQPVSPTPWSPVPALEHPELLAAPVQAALARWAASEPRVATQVRAVAIDPAISDTAAFMAAYALAAEQSVNCVVVVGRRDGAERIAAVAVQASTRADVNNAVKRLLDVRKATFLPTERATAESGMEYGGITPVGLPAGWRFLLDSGAAAAGGVVIGSGVRRSKLLLPGDLLAELPGAEVVDVARPESQDPAR